MRVLVDSKALFSIIGSEMDWTEDLLRFDSFHFRCHSPCFGFVLMTCGSVIAQSLHSRTPILRMHVDVGSRLRWHHDYFNYFLFVRKLILGDHDACRCIDALTQLCFFPRYCCYISHPPNVSIIQTLMINDRDRSISINFRLHNSLTPTVIQGATERQPIGSKQNTQLRRKLRRICVQAKSSGNRSEPSRSLVGCRIF